ncbi:hypothetical protein LTS09_015598 [Friedmanniomyces endolithicus]|nr:hypothetical protein LTS09_015598 [Friedmanniomyces endolithicus]
MLSRLITSPFAVEHGERAVEILDVELRKLVVAEAFPESQVEEARELLALAKERSAAAKEKDKQAPPIAGPSQEEGTVRRMSHADRLAIREAMLLEPASRRHGLATPGASRTASGVTRVQAGLPGEDIVADEQEVGGRRGDDRGGGGGRRGLATPGASRTNTAQFPARDGTQDEDIENDEHDAEEQDGEDREAGEGGG